MLDICDLKIKNKCNKIMYIDKNVSLYVCLNRFQTKDQTKYKMITCREAFVILTIALSSVFTFHCPTNQGCICQPSREGGTELNCLMQNDSSVIVTVQPGKFIKVCLCLQSHERFILI